MHVSNPPPPLWALPSGNDPALLPYLPKWNWGAALAQYAWAFAHGLYGVGALVLLANLCGLGLFTMLWLGSAGNDLAWRQCPFSSYEEFTRKQQTWARTGIWMTVILLILTVAVSIECFVQVSRLLSAMSGDLSGQNY